MIRIHHFKENETRYSIGNILYFIERAVNLEKQSLFLMFQASAGLCYVNSKIYSW